ncbi:MAG: hypothetical protein EXX96DRAFT_319983 [Benjaminiella poitrasii]|nr:MAG: hypothetical protein EXX96DRAFT_319983 [Benjaminiella poitrasii]
MPTSSKTPNTTSSNSSNPTNSLEKKMTARSNSLAPKENSKKLESKNRSKSSDEGNDRRRRRGNSFLTNTTHSATNATSNTSSKRLLIAKGGITKNTPPVSVLTGRTRKQSRSTAVEKKPIIVLSKETVKEEEEQKIKGKDYCTTEKDAVHPIGEEAALKPASVNEDDTSMSSTTCSTLTTTTATIIDEHDAEVAATIGKSVTNHSDELAMPPLLATTQTSSRSSSSFSPTLARPETPEVVVDQLRLRFESILSASAPQTPLPSSKINRKSVISPEFASRVKEMKPRNPVGTRVKNMVDFFMDENLHKWEF